MNDNNDNFRGNRIGKENGSNGKERGVCPILTQSLVCKLPLDEIVYFESEGRCTTIVLYDGTVYRINERMAFFENYIDNEFYAVGKYYVNLSNIRSIDSSATVIFDNKAKLFLTKKNYVGLKQKFANYIAI